MSKKTKALFSLIANEESLATAANRYVQLKLELKKLEVAHEKRIAELNASFERDVSSMVSELAGLESGAQLYCETHRELFEGDARHRDYRNARIGFRLNPPKVEKLLPKDTFDAMAERLSELPWGEQYVVYKTSLNKEALLTHRADLTESQLRQAGIRFEQGETFYIEPTFDSVEGIRREAA